MDTKYVRPVRPVQFKKGTLPGQHMLVDFFGVEESVLKNNKALMRMLCAALKQGGFHVIQESGSHKFKRGGQGVTGFVLLAESHATFHTYPEYGYMAFDLYSCGMCDPYATLRDVTQYLKPKKTVKIFYSRGCASRKNKPARNNHMLLKKLGRTKI